MLKDAVGLLGFRGKETRRDAFRTNHDHLARLHVAFVRRADNVKGAGLGSEDDRVFLRAAAVANASHAQRTEPARIAYGKHTVTRHHDERERTLNPAQCVTYRFRQSMFFGLRDQMNDDLSVAGGLKDRALGLQPAADLPRVHQIAIVGQRNHALVAVHHDGLGVQQRRISGGGIAVVTDGNIAAEGLKHGLVEDVGDQTHSPMRAQALTVGRDNSGGLLSAMLQLVQTKVGER